MRARLLKFDGRTATVLRDSLAILSSDSTKQSTRTIVKKSTGTEDRIAAANARPVRSRDGAK